MWTTEPVDYRNANTRHLVKNTATGGYLSLNHQGGGALHFNTKEEAQEVADLLSMSNVR